jgi:hypothetical protein
MTAEMPGHGPTDRPPQGKVIPYIVRGDSLALRSLRRLRACSSRRSTPTLVDISIEDDRVVLFAYQRGCGARQTDAIRRRTSEQFRRSLE